MMNPARSRRWAWSMSTFPSILRTRRMQIIRRFKETLAEHPDATIHVHCIYNARVSAFFYRYAAEGFGLSVSDAFHNMESIWRPGSDWADFVGIPGAAGQPNRYAGEDY